LPSRVVVREWRGSLPAYQSRTVPTDKPSRRAARTAPSPSTSRSRSASATVSLLCISEASRVRLVGLEPTRAFAHMLLKHARKPIPPQPRGDGKCSARACIRRHRTYVRCSRIGRTEPGPAATGQATRRGAQDPWLHCRPVTYAPLSSRGLGRRILSPETRVRIPVAVPHQKPRGSGAFLFR
jgi:hypothetical protein